MHVKAKQMAFGGLLLAVTVVCMALGSVIETNTLFLLAAAAFFCRDCYPRVWTSHRSCFLSGSSVIRISCHAK